MTKQSQVAADPKYKTVLDHGFVGLVDHMGSDGAIVQAARVSYGDGTKTVLEDRGLIRYLMRHKHTSPFEMCQIKIHIKMPIFVMRQWVRHRTASLNEYSGRYSVMTDEFYVPEPDVIMAQSKDNKQGRAGALGIGNATGVRFLMDSAHEASYSLYKVLLGEKDSELADDIYDPEDPLFDDEFSGIARETARAVLPVSNYTELYWTQNLHNMMHLLKLRMDSHAQYEIRVFAQAVYDLIQPLFPEALQAFDDYVRDATSNSRMETSLLKVLLLADKPAKDVLSDLLIEAGSVKALGEKYDLSLRELREFAAKWGLLLIDPPSKAEDAVTKGYVESATTAPAGTAKAPKKSRAKKTK